MKPKRVKNGTIPLDQSLPTSRRTRCLTRNSNRQNSWRRVVIEFQLYFDSTRFVATLPLCHHHSHSLRRLCARTIARFVVPLINTLSTSRQHRPHCSPLCRPRMCSQSRLLSLPGTVVAFCRPPKFTTFVNHPVFHPRRSHKLSMDHQSTSRSISSFSPSIWETMAELGLRGLDLFQPLTSVTNATSNTLYDSGTPPSQYSAENKITSGAPGPWGVFFDCSFSVSFIQVLLHSVIPVARLSSTPLFLRMKFLA